MSDNEQDIDGLLGAYALDVVDDDERRRVEEYLQANPRAAAEVQEHREVATLLAYTGMDAPEGLWDRIAGARDEPAPAPGAELAKVLPIDAVSDERASSGSRVSSFGKWALMTAAAALIAVAAVAVFDLSSTPSDPVQSALEAARSDRDSRITTLTAEGSDAVVEAIIDDDGRGFLVADQLPQLPREQTYQLWGVVGDDVISIGILGPNPAVETFTARVDLAALAVTIEPRRRDQRRQSRRGVRRRAHLTLRLT